MLGLWQRLVRWWYARGRWKVRRTTWPYLDGWGMYQPRSRTILDTGLDRLTAVQRVLELNRRH